MAETDKDLIQKARQAFGAGNVARGGKIIHNILKREINNAEAWSLLYTHIGKGKSFDEFQRDFVKAYYPEQYDSFVAEVPETNTGSFRRVSLVQDRIGRSETATENMHDFSQSEQGLSLASRKIEKKEAKKPKRRFLGLFGRREKKNKGEKAVEGSGNKQTEVERRSPSKLNPLKSLFIRKSQTEEEPEQEPATQPNTLIAPDEFVEKSPPADVRPPARPRPTSNALVEKIIGDSDPTEGRRKPEEARRMEPLLSKLGARNEIRLIIADDIKQTRENIRKLLLFEPAIEVVGVAASGREAVDLTIAHEPDVVLLDINMPDMDGLQALNMIRAEKPLTQVIMLTVQDDPGYLREALQLGARDYLIKPPMIDDLLETVKNAFEIGRSERERIERIAKTTASKLDSESGKMQGISVALFSPKGGVGCSMLAANLAVSLRSTGKSVALIDCNLQYGGIGMLFNESPRTSVADLAINVNELDLEVLESACIVHESSGVRMLLAPKQLGKGEGVTGSQISALIDILRRQFAYVIVDTSSVLDDLTISVLDVVDQVLLVTTQDIPSINDIRRMLDLAPNLGVEPDKISLILNQYNERINITPEKISANLNREFAAVIPLDKPTVVPSINRGVPFMTSNQGRATPLGESIKALTEQCVLIYQMAEELRS